MFACVCVCVHTVFAPCVCKKKSLKEKPKKARKKKPGIHSKVFRALLLSIYRKEEDGAVGRGGRGGPPFSIVKMNKNSTCVFVVERQKKIMRAGGRGVRKTSNGFDFIKPVRLGVAAK